MLDPAMSFFLGNLLAMIGWAGLITSLFVKAARPAVWTGTQVMIPALLAAAYVLLIWQGRPAFADGGFGSLEEVRALFAHDSALAAGWLHYLAFDLFVGSWITRDGAKRGVAPLLVLPCLPLAFLFGPSGLLLYFVLRQVSSPARQEALQ